MKRRFNYTDRKRITRDDVTVRVHRQNGSISTFSTDIDLSNLELPDSAEVYVEAYHRSLRERYSAGTVEDLDPPTRRQISELAYTKLLKYRVMVVETSTDHRRILALAERLKPDNVSNLNVLLPFQRAPLGNEPWKVEYEGIDGPVLMVNSRIPKSVAAPDGDPKFFAHTYPYVLREILTHIIYVEGITDPADPEMNWQKDWIQFVDELLGRDERPEELDTEEPGFEDERVRGWINRAVKQFCEKHNRLKRDLWE
jgi:hypothetical protein